MRFSDDEKFLLRQLADKLNLSHTAVVTIAIREKAKREGIKLTGTTR